MKKINVFTYILSLMIIFSLTLLSNHVNAEMTNHADLDNFSLYPSKETTDSLKEWTMLFSSEVDENSVNQDNLYILDYTNKKINFMTWSVQDNLIKITPLKPYEYNREYTLVVLPTIKSKTGQTLKPFKFQFKVNQPDLMEKIQLTEDLQAIISNKDYNMFALKLVANGQVVGGYETAKGSLIGGRIIDQSTSEVKSEKQIIDNIQYYFLYDTETGLLRAVYWENLSAQSYFEEWANPSSLTESLGTAKINVLLTNEFRVKNNQSILEAYDGINEAAYLHSKDMAENDYFNHKGIDGRSPGQRIQSACSYYSSVGENIAAGYNNIFLAHNGWINSKGHRINMLKENYNFMGTGSHFEAGSKYGAYYTTMFIKSDSCNL